MSNIELLAPAGNFECLKAAVQSGADAVYFAGKNFGARSFAQNFSMDEIKEAVDYCHLRGVKTHITVNTACLDSEFSEVFEFINYIYSVGADAIIVSDVGIISEIKRCFPKLSIHASTQMTIHNLDGVRFAESLGVDRVVLSRELPFTEIEYISNNCSAEIEIFTHGALCMCYSGQCLLSSMIGGRSGNRGSCAQPCRLPFGITKDNKKYILSLKDMSLVNHINKIKGSKIKSLKIEGRMKGAQYVAAVVSTYRKYLDNSVEVLEKDKEILERVFYRGGLTDGYFSGAKGPKMFDFEKPDNPYLRQSKQILSDFDKNYSEVEERKVNLNLSFFASVADKPSLKVKYNDTEIVYVHESKVQQAKNNPVDKNFIVKQLSKTGGTPFSVSDMDIKIGEGVFFSKSELNEIRRNALLLFTKNLVDSYRRNSDFSCIDDSITENIVSCDFTAYVMKKEQLDIVKEFDFKRIYIHYDMLEDVRLYAADEKKKFVLSLPEISFDSEVEKIERKLKIAKKNGINKLLINNPSQLKYACDFELILSHRFNIWNKYSLNLYFKKYNITSAFLSPELSSKAIKSINKPVESEIIVYGHIPVMITENCIIKNTGSCPCNDDFHYIIDRMGARFPVKRTDSSCRNVLYNCVPIYLADKKSLLSKMDCVKNLYFTVENRETVKKICSDYFENKVSLPEIFTRGHYLK